MDKKELLIKNIKYMIDNKEFENITEEDMKNLLKITQQGLSVEAGVETLCSLCKMLEPALKTVANIMCDIADKLKVNK